MKESGRKLVRKFCPNELISSTLDLSKMVVSSQGGVISRSLVMLDLCCDATWEYMRQVCWCNYGYMWERGDFFSPNYPRGESYGPQACIISFSRCLITCIINSHKHVS